MEKNMKLRVMLKHLLIAVTFMAGFFFLGYAEGLLHWTEASRHYLILVGKVLMGMGAGFASYKGYSALVFGGDYWGWNRDAKEAPVPPKDPAPAEPKVPLKDAHIDF